MNRYRTTIRNKRTLWHGSSAQEYNQKETPKVVPDITLQCQLYVVPCANACGDARR
nr:hypothetical protein [uncultured Allomuricauda sp.]